MNDGFRYNFPPCLMDDFLEACRFYDVPDHLVETVLEQIDYPLYDAYFVNPELCGQERSNEFVAQAFNEVNREYDLGYEEIPVSNHDWNVDGDYYIPQNVDNWEKDSYREW